MKKTMWRQVTGHGCVLLGVMLFGTSLYFAGEPEVKMSPHSRSAVAGASAIGGGLLSFGVGRRLLNRPEDEPAAHETNRA